MTNIALIVLDTLRADAFERHFDWLPGTQFTNAYSTSHWTTPAHASLFTGQYASEVGVYAGSQHLDCDQKVLAERLQEAGYTTRALSTNVNISSVYRFDRGFEQFESLGRHHRQLRQVSDPNLFNWSEYTGPDSGVLSQVRAVWDCIQSDCDTLRSLRNGFGQKFEWLNRFGGKGNADDMGASAVNERVREIDFGDREFLFVNLMEAHYPYSFPGSERLEWNVTTPSNPVGEIDDSTDIEDLRGYYEKASAYLSEVYHEIFNCILKDFDVIVTLSDHGEHLGEDRRYGHSYGLHPVLTHVPISIYPEEDRGVVDTPVSILDIHRVILNAAEVDEYNSRGRPIRSSDIESGTLLTECHGIPHPDRNLESLREWVASTATLEQYQQWKRGVVLSNGSYGYESDEDFCISDPSQKTTAKSELTMAVNTLDIDERGSEGATVPDSIKEELRHLGYL